MKSSASSKIRAVFIGFQETLAEPIPLFNLTGGSRDKSTVTLVTLLREGIDVPYYPYPTALPIRVAGGDQDKAIKKAKERG